MSLEPMIWVLSGDAPVADVNEYAVLAAMADMAGPDGCGTWLSNETIAARARISERAVARCKIALQQRGVIGKGDQRLVAHYRADRRPVVWDLLIPFAWFPNVNRVNAERERQGRPPLTAENRPPIAPAPEKRARVDQGKPRPRQDPGEERGDFESPRSESDENTASPARGDLKTPRENGHGVTTSPERGDFKSPKPVIETGYLSLGANVPPGAGPSNPGEREDLVGPNTSDPAELIVRAWIQARAGEPVPVSAPAAVRRSAHELLAEGIDADLLCAAAADMARHGWVNLRKHLEHWTPPKTPAQARTGATAGPASRTATDCPWCDPWGWYETRTGSDARCPHAENPPAGHPAADQTRSAA